MTAKEIKSLKKGDLIRNKKPYKGEKRYRFVEKDGNLYAFSWESSYKKGDFDDNFRHLFSEIELEYYDFSQNNAAASDK